MGVSFLSHNLGYRSRTVATLVTLGVLAVSPQSSFATDDYRQAHTLDVAEQTKTEDLAYKIWSSPEMQKERQIVYDRWVNDPAAATELGKTQLREAIDKMAAATSMMVANERDPDNPYFTWVWEPETWFNDRLPGQSVGIENPDNLYRHAAIDGFSKYEITVKPNSPHVVGFNLQVYDVFIEDSPRSNALIDVPLGAMAESDITERAADGSYVITVDSEPANGRPNHIQTTPDTRAIWTRATNGDWENEIPPDISIKRIKTGEPTGSELKPPSERDLILRATYMFGVGAHRVFYMKNEAGYNFLGEANRKPKLLPRGFKRWGYFSFANWKLHKGEGLLVTLDPMGFKYTGFVVTTPWMVTREFVRANGSLNKSQAKPNNDGTYTYVISAEDPGIHNWLDSHGLYEGGYMLRWQYATTPELPSGDNGIKEVKVVNLADLKTILPAETTWVTAQQRKEQYAKRAKAFSRRAGTAADLIYNDVVKHPEGEQSKGQP